jgi:Glyoxalase-like domain
MMIRTTVLALAAICYAGFHYPFVQSPRVELDHVFVVVQPVAAAEIAALEAAGFTVGSRVAKHPGQGTASRAVLFENAYLKLIWVDSSVAIDAEHTNVAQWFRDAAAWRTSGHVHSA